MTLVSPDWRFLRVNPSFCRMLGYEQRALLVNKAVPRLRQIQAILERYPRNLQQAVAA